MEFNPSKCHTMRIIRKRKPTARSYLLREHPLSAVDCATYLGVDISSRLDWSRHVQKITAKASKTLGFVKRNDKTVSRTTKELAYKALVIPHLEYSVSAWDLYRANHIYAMEMVQRRAARYVLHRYHNTPSVTDMLVILGWEPLQVRRAKIRLTLMYKSVNQFIAIPVERYLISRISSTRYSHTTLITTNTATFRGPSHCGSHCLSKLSLHQPSQHSGRV